LVEWGVMANLTNLPVGGHRSVGCGVLIQGKLDLSARLLRMNQEHMMELQENAVGTSILSPSSRILLWHRRVIHKVTRKATLS
jgi:hypothetical protein